MVVSVVVEGIVVGYGGVITVMENGNTAIWWRVAA